MVVLETDLPEMRKSIAQTGIGWYDKSRGEK